jgi:hypothetical protein
MPLSLYVERVGEKFQVSLALVCVCDVRRSQEKLNPAPPAIHPSIYLHLLFTYIILFLPTEQTSQLPYIGLKYHNTT